jgi:hypothetical protein
MMRIAYAHNMKQHIAIAVAAALPLTMRESKVTAMSESKLVRDTTAACLRRSKGKRMKGGERRWLWL